VSAPSLSVVVTTWDSSRRDELSRCLAALGRQSLVPSELIVVVDHNPELAAWAREGHDGAVVVENDRERGVVGARNTGIDRSGGEVVVFTDDDTEAEPDWLENLAAPFADPGVVGVAGELLPSWAGPPARWLPTEFYWVFGCSYTGLPTELAPVRNPIGANMAVRAAAVREVGGFRNGAAPRPLRHRGQVLAGGHALEDTDLGIRIARAFPGQLWLYQPAATVHHNVHPGQATLGYFVRRCFSEGRGKAALARGVGAESGLASERRHALETVPRGVLRGLADLRRGDLWGPARAAALLLGTGVAAAGFLLGSLTARHIPERS
jgi:hypothetical protein